MDRQVAFVYAGTGDVFIWLLLVLEFLQDLLIL